MRRQIQTAAAEGVGPVEGATTVPEALPGQRGGVVARGSLATLGKFCYNVYWELHGVGLP